MGKHLKVFLLVIDLPLALHSPPVTLLAGGLLTSWSNMWTCVPYAGHMDYRLLVEFTAEQREHLDQKRAQGMPAGVYIRSLVQEDLTVSKTGGVSRNAPPSVSEPLAFTEASPPARTADHPTPRFNVGHTPVIRGGAQDTNTPYYEDQDQA